MNSGSCSGYLQTSWDEESGNVHTRERPPPGGGAAGDGKGAVWYMEVFERACLGPW
ncbi:hypothetical protein VE03_04471 [Pseudogymnoascus sp. 23342-1-I1]|nr:hypothetical protein VE03_04471 [Pseudogymnoascus sp. 23342-1-I1]